jgi:hypothetical protein
MPTRRLLIDGDGPGPWILALDNRTLAFGPDPAHADVVLSNLQVVRIRCELELAEGSVVIADQIAAAGAPPVGHELQPGETLDAGAVHVQLVAPEKSKPASDRPAQAVPTSAPAGVFKRLVVIDGADRGRWYPLPEAGRTSIGKNPKHADIVLHDLFVASVHCEFLVDGDRVVVAHRAGQSGTLVNGTRITEQELRLGDVVRVGNSHLQLDLGVGEPPPVGATAAPGAAVASSNVAAKPFAAASQPAPPEPLELVSKLEGQVLGQYQFGALLGRGLTGLVFRAHHRQNDQPVTVKVLSPEFPNSDAELQTFARALKVVVPLRHPHLVSLFGAGKTGTFCWIAREFVDGESLAALIARLRTENKLSWKRACRVAVHLGWTLDFLEQQRVLPGHLTPANVLVDTATKATKLADVMLDRALAGSQLADSVREQKQRAEIGYTAPELIESGATADHRAALYALGAVLYAVLTGQPPFSGTTPAEISAQIRDTKLVKPSKLLRETPPPFETAVMKLLARHPEDRYQSAAELLAVVEPIANFNDIKL